MKGCVSMTFGEKLKLLRNERGLSQQELANILKTSKQVISRYELGQTTPKIGIAAKWCQILGINLNNMLNDDKNIFDDWSDTLLVGEEPSFSLRKADSFDFDSEPFKSLSANKIKELKSLLESACYLTIEQIQMLKQLADNLKK